MWDSDALRIPATAYAQTLCATCLSKMRYLILVFSLVLLTIEKSEIVQLDKDGNFELKNFKIRDAYILSNTERFVIASEIKVPDDHKGLRLLYTENNELKFKSQDVGESYIYRPTFFKFPRNSFIVVCERAFEYSLGVDVYEFSNGKIIPIGTLDLGIEEDGQSTSIVPKMTIERVGDQFRFGFAGKVIVNPGGPNETKIDGEKLKATYFPGIARISLLIKTE